MQAVCPRCGLPSEGGLCKSCTQDTTKMFSCPDQAEVVICSVCGSQQAKGKWLLPEDCNIEEMAASAAADAVWLHQELGEPNIEVELKKVGATRYLAMIDISGIFQGRQISEQCRIAVRIKMIACDRCSRIAGKYFESTVQLRGNAVRPISAREMEEAKKTARDMADSGYRGGEMLSFIQEMKEVKGGLDIILGSTQLGRRMARAFQERFGGRLLETAKLVGKKDNRDVFRSTLLVRFPRLKRGDIISFRGSLFYVSGFDGKTTLITSLREGRRTSMSEESSEAVPILGNRADALTATVISVDEDVLEIMDPETFRSALAARPRALEVRPGEDVTVVRTADGFVVL
ncbi:MAG TPA: 60S ribosomal export protein NMD3 [Methanothrix sp.]|nr:60S ribosomal export protein NMD3 [Methanothrix sp.]